MAVAVLDENASPVIIVLLSDVPDVPLGWRHLIIVILVFYIIKMVQFIGKAAKIKVYPHLVLSGYLI